MKKKQPTKQNKQTNNQRSTQAHFLKQTNKQKNKKTIGMHTLSQNVTVKPDANLTWNPAILVSWDLSVMFVGFFCLFVLCVCFLCTVTQTLCLYCCSHRNFAKKRCLFVVSTIQNTHNTQTKTKPSKKNKNNVVTMRKINKKNKKTHTHTHTHKLENFHKKFEP